MFIRILTLTGLRTLGVNTASDFILFCGQLSSDLNECVSGLSLYALLPVTVMFYRTPSHLPLFPTAALTSAMLCSYSIISSSCSSFNLILSSFPSYCRHSLIPSLCSARSLISLGLGPDSLAVNVKSVVCFLTVTCRLHRGSSPLRV